MVYCSQHAFFVEYCPLLTIFKISWKYFGQRRKVTAWRRRNQFTMASSLSNISAKLSLLKNSPNDHTNTRKMLVFIIFKILVFNFFHYVIPKIKDNSKTNETWKYQLWGHFRGGQKITNFFQHPIDPLTHFFIFWFPSFYFLVLFRLYIT